MNKIFRMLFVIVLIGLGTIYVIAAQIVEISTVIPKKINPIEIVGAEVRGAGASSQVKLDVQISQGSEVTVTVNNKLLRRDIFLADIDTTIRLRRYYNFVVFSDSVKVTFYLIDKDTSNASVTLYNTWNRSQQNRAGLAGEIQQ